MKRSAAALSSAGATDENKTKFEPKPIQQEAELEHETKEPATKKRMVEDRELWKLAKGKYLLTTYLCPDDWNRLYNNQQKVKRLDDDRFSVNFELCHECVRINCRATDLIAPMKKKVNNE